MSIKLLLIEPNLACSTLIVSLQILRLICKFERMYSFLHNVVVRLLRGISESKCYQTSINMVSVSNAQERGFLTFYDSNEGS
jgi:hypothetical protein